MFLSFKFQSRCQCCFISTKTIISCTVRLLANHHQYTRVYQDTDFKVHWYSTVFSFCSNWMDWIPQSSFQLLNFSSFQMKKMNTRCRHFMWSLPFQGLISRNADCLYTVLLIFIWTDFCSLTALNEESSRAGLACYSNNAYGLKNSKLLCTITVLPFFILCCFRTLSGNWR